MTPKTKTTIIITKTTKQKKTKLKIEDIKKNKRKNKKKNKKKKKDKSNNKNNDNNKELDKQE